MYICIGLVLNLPPENKPWNVAHNIFSELPHNASLLFFRKKINEIYKWKILRDNGKLKPNFVKNLQRQFSTKNFAENWKPNQTLWINVALNFSVRENIILCATSVCFKWQVLWYFWHDAVKFKLLFIFVTAWCWICHLKTSRGTLTVI